MIETALSEQFLVATLFAQPALVKEQDGLHVLHGGEPVGDGNGRPASHEDVQRVLDQLLGIGVDAGRGLVKNQHVGLVGQRTRE